MLANARAKGAADALAYFKVAWVLDSAKQMAVGDLGKAFIQGPKAFQPGGMLHWKNVFWPSIPGHGARNWIGRAGTLSMIPMAMGALSSQDPNEGRASHALGTLGSLAGSAYGTMAGGLLGMPIGAAIGSRLGHGVGHLLGSRPQDPYQ